MDERQVRRIRDEEQLRLLALFHYITGGITILFGLVPLIYVLMGLLLAVLPTGGGEDAAAARVMGLLFSVVGVTLVVVCVLFGVLKIYSGRCIAQRRQRALSLGVAAVMLLGIPWSTLLGVFTFVVLLRPSVERLYLEQGSGGAATGQAAG